MKAIVVKRYGSPDVLEYEDVLEPVAAPDSVTIRVAAAGVTFADLLMRSAIYPESPKPPFIPGLEVAGIVEKLPTSGLNPFGLQIGDRVIALTNSLGGYAEYVAAPVNHVVRIPNELAFAFAAALPVNYLTAHHALFGIGGLKAGNRVLIHSAAGGVGTAAVQLAKLCGAEVFGVAGPEKQGFLREIGVNQPIDYSREDFHKKVREITPQGVDLVLDPIGGKNLSKSYGCVRPGGKLIVYGLTSAVSANGKRNLWRMIRAFANTPRFNPLDLMSRNVTVSGMAMGKLVADGYLFQETIKQVLQFACAQKITPIIRATFPLADSATAHWMLHKRENLGKVILSAGAWREVAKQ